MTKFYSRYHGKGLAYRWARAGMSVMIGSRNVDRAKETASELNQLLSVSSITGK
ncbi:MAG: NAD(P)-binding domain-containing protein, partial [Candidatus Moranbacteria bacterium]|nr:NAD(P)-binding domain-containing protein [Candidatus Moranbacteria bacterium]